MQTAPAHFNPHDHYFPAIAHYWRALMIVRGESVDTPVIAMIPNLLIEAIHAATILRAANPLPEPPATYKEISNA